MISVLGSLLVLIAYAANQLGLLRVSSVLYSLFNLAGSGILSVIAVVEGQWGFLLLEGVWALISLAALIRLLACRSRKQ